MAVLLDGVFQGKVLWWTGARDELNLPEAAAL